MAGSGGNSSAFEDLRRIADWFTTSPQRGSLQIERTVQRLGTTAVALLGRELRGTDARRRTASRHLLELLAGDVMCRARVVSELRSITDETSTAGDEAKVSALGLLSELGERAAARFADPSRIQQRSAVALAAQLSSDADVASAADLMVRQLATTDIVQMLEVMVDAAPPAARRLSAELAVRVDLDASTREQIAAAVARGGVTLDHAAPPAVERRRAPRPSQVAVLVDASARLVVVASKKVIGERRYRRWAVLIGANGRIDDCLHEDDAGNGDDAAPLITTLCADGYRVASSELAHARTVVAAAARLTAMSPAADGSTLTSAYYLGRDLLDLRDAHLGDRAAQPAATLARALEHLADGDHAKALALLELCDPDQAEAAAALAVIHLAAKDYAQAIAALERALAAEPEWPLHHWNLAVALHATGDHAGCFHALRRFVTTSAAPTGLYADPAQVSRVTCAERMIAELERTARLTGTSLRRRRRTKKRA
ncbi:MAG TPA: tetratricopeptide repeat protein [Kofleriaceae bacterium]|nr:tetratricopeptide repeat protein [Kofleriaceae bacterium]